MAQADRSSWSMRRVFFAIIISIFGTIALGAHVSVSYPNATRQFNMWTWAQYVDFIHWVFAGYRGKILVYGGVAIIGILILFAVFLVLEQIYGFLKRFLIN